MKVRFLGGGSSVGFKSSGTMLGRKKKTKTTFKKRVTAVTLAVVTFCCLFIVVVGYQQHTSLLQGAS